MAIEKDLERLRKAENINNDKRQQTNDRVKKGLFDYLTEFILAMVSE